MASLVSQKIAEEPFSTKVIWLFFFFFFFCHKHRVGFTDGENEKRFLALEQWKFYIRAAGKEKEKVKGYIPLAATCFHPLNLTLVISRAQTADSWKWGRGRKRREVSRGVSKEYCVKYL